MGVAAKRLGYALGGMPGLPAAPRWDGLPVRSDPFVSEKERR